MSDESIIKAAKKADKAEKKFKTVVLDGMVEVQDVLVEAEE